MMSDERKEGFRRVSDYGFQVSGTKGMEQRAERIGLEAGCGGLQKDFGGRGV